jgi:hypothetical protein
MSGYLDDFLVQRKIKRLEEHYQERMEELRGPASEDPIEDAVRKMIDLILDNHRKAMFYTLILEFGDCEV